MYEKGNFKTTTVTIESVNKFRTTQMAIERLKLVLSLRNHIENEEIRRRTRVEDVMKRVADMKWNWNEHFARQEDSRWRNRMLQWNPSTTEMLVHRKNFGQEALEI